MPIQFYIASVNQRTWLQIDKLNTHLEPPASAGGFALDGALIGFEIDPSSELDSGSSGGFSCAIEL
jgi:hypothetical protein